MRLEIVLESNEKVFISLCFTLVYLVKSDTRVPLVRHMNDKKQTYVGNGDTMMQRITLRLPEQQIGLLQQMVDAGEYPNVSEAVRAAVRDLVEKRAGRVLKDNDQVSFKV